MSAHLDATNSLKTGPLNARGGRMAQVKESVVMNPQNTLQGRVCSRAGCGRFLVDPDGNPIFNRHYCKL
jgi:hypothetical protein